MAIIVNEHAAVVMAKGLYSGGSWLNTSASSSNRIAIFSGTPPTTVDQPWDNNTYAAQELVRFTSFDVDTGLTEPRVHINSINSTIATATGTGTATWAAIYSTSWDAIVVDVSDSSGTGVVQIDNTSITSGTDVTLLGFSFTFSTI